MGPVTYPDRDLYARASALLALGDADLLTKLRELPARYGSDGCHHADGRAILGGCYKHECWQPSMWSDRQVEQLRGGLRHLAYCCWIPSHRNAARDASSYGLKHRAEESARTAGSPCYVSNGCMIAACVLCGVRAYDRDSINCRLQVRTGKQCSCGAWFRRRGNQRYCSAACRPVPLAQAIAGIRRKAATR